MQYSQSVLSRAEMTSRDASILFLRAALTVIFIAHGSRKLFGTFGGGGISGTADYMASVGANPGTLWEVVAGLVELAGGVAVGLGLAVRPAALVLALDMVLVVLLTNWQNGFFAEKASGGWKINLVLFSAAMSVALTGAGRVSVDSRIAQRTKRCRQ